jgi:hypothetical protein
MKLKFIKDWSTHKAGNEGNFEPNIGSHLISLGVAEKVASNPLFPGLKKPEKVEPVKRKKGRKAK